MLGFGIWGPYFCGSFWWFSRMWILGIALNRPLQNGMFYEINQLLGIHHLWKPPFLEPKIFPTSKQLVVEDEGTHTKTRNALKTTLALAN